jgi:excinuclease UvrABC nuclease subunit
MATTHNDDGPGMPWTANRWSWDMTVILLRVPCKPGVYAIWRGETCLYVGETVDLLSRLVMHHQDDSRALAGEQPTTFWFEVQPGMERIPRLNALIAQLKPAFRSGAR